MSKMSNTFSPVIFQMENILLDKRGKSFSFPSPECARLLRDGTEWCCCIIFYIGHLKLTDFGLSRHLPQGARAYTICGTLQYMGKKKAKAGG